MAWQPLSDDTSPEIEEIQIERWRAMTPEQKLKIAMDMSETVRQLALVGIRQRYPDASPREQFLRLAILTLGADLAARGFDRLVVVVDDQYARRHRHSVGMRHEELVNAHCQPRSRSSAARSPIIRHDALV